MLQEIKSFYLANQTIILLLLLLLISIAVLSKKSMQLWIVDFWVRFPFIGLIARRSKDNTMGNNGWTRAEAKLCSIYNYYVNSLDQKKFDNRILYLKKAGDLGKSPTSAWIWVLIALLVVLEGLGFSYLVATVLAREGSANIHTLLMFTVSLVIAGVLVVVTHNAGDQYRRTSKLRACFSHYKETGGSSYYGKTIALNEDQSIDDGEPPYQQTQSRVAKDVRDKGSFGWGIAAVILIVVIAFASTVMRVENLKSDIIKQTQGAESSGNPFAELSLPSEVTKPQHDADKKATDEISQHIENEGYMGFLILGLIFIFTQVVGMHVGYKYGFDGVQSKEAYNDTLGVSTYDGYVRLHTPLINMADSRLKDLQQRMEEYSHTKLVLNKTFFDYIQENTHGDTHVFANPNPIESAKSKLSKMNNVDEQKNYFMSLPDDIKKELTPWLKQRKEEVKDNELKKQKELDDLF